MLSLLLVAGAVLANLAFVGLGATFDYPAVLQRPGSEVLAAFHADAWSISGLFLLLALGAGLLAPISLRMARLVGPGRPATALAVTGVAAATVQVVGLLRWPLVVPFLSDAGGFETLNTVLGQVIGEACGYALTAAWTVIAVRVLPVGRAARALGLVAAALILAGLLVPFGVPGADLANFIGYVAWSAWLLVLAAVLRPGRSIKEGRVVLP